MEYGHFFIAFIIAASAAVFFYRLDYIYQFRKNPVGRKCTFMHKGVKHHGIVKHRYHTDYLVLSFNDSRYKVVRVKDLTPKFFN